MVENEKENSKPTTPYEPAQEDIRVALHSRTATIAKIKDELATELNVVEGSRHLLLWKQEHRLNSILFCIGKEARNLVPKNSKDSERERIQIQKGLFYFFLMGFFRPAKETRTKANTKRLRTIRKNLLDLLDDAHESDWESERIKECLSSAAELCSEALEQKERDETNYRELNGSLAPIFEAMITMLGGVEPATRALNMFLKNVSEVGIKMDSDFKKKWRGRVKLRRIYNRKKKGS